jgi:hypothetical protein
MDLKAVSWEGMGWIHLDQDRYSWWAVVKVVVNLWVPSSVGNFLTSLGTVSFSKWTLLHGVS